MLTLYTIGTIDPGIKEALRDLDGTISLQPTDHGHVTILAQGPHLVMTDDMVLWPMDWFNREPPFLFPAMPARVNTVLALVLTKLGHYELAMHYAEDPVLTGIIQCFQEITGDVTSPNQHWSNDYIGTHNQAIFRHYAHQEHDDSSASVIYEKAIELAPSAEMAAFTVRHYSVYLLDHGQMKQAEIELRRQLDHALPDEAGFAIKFDLVNILGKQLAVPYDADLVDELKSMTWDTLQYYETAGMSVATAMLLVEASEIANTQESYSESLGYINRAITIYDNEGLPEFRANALLRKATLLYTWAQDGNPQFFKPAVETFQQALKTFSKQEAPAVFAEIHHHLGVIYAEMPHDSQQEGIWAAVSASSFKEALQYFTKTGFPYDYAMIANNYANALMKYPEAKNSDNFEKAIFYYNEALSIRKADEFPTERVHTLLNYLEACWRVHNINHNMELLRHRDMTMKAKEVKALTTDPGLLAQADEHLEKLIALGRVLLS